MVELKSCKKCGKMFSADNDYEYCKKCRLDVEDHFKIVREYVYDHPSATVTEVADGTGVSKKEILKYLRDERLELKEESSFLSCQRCGKSIKSGRFCRECSNELKNGFKEAFKPDKSKEKKKKGRGWHTKKK